MSYAVKEIHYTLQGEGANWGRPAVFVRLSGCSLWSGRGGDRGKGGSCSAWCDTDFVGTDGLNGGRYSAYDLARVCSALWPGGARLHPDLTRGLRPFVVLTGGEPMLQVDGALVAALHSHNFEVAVETNGTIPVPPSIDWITVSPKAGSAVVQRSGHELKVIYPQDGLDLDALLLWDFGRFYLQPMSGFGLGENCQDALAYCLEHPRWRLCLQMHKLVGVP